jgi:hypothetical protein
VLLLLVSTCAMHAVGMLGNWHCCSHRMVVVVVGEGGRDALRAVWAGGWANCACACACKCFVPLPHHSPPPGSCASPDQLRADSNPAPPPAPAPLSTQHSQHSQPPGSREQDGGALTQAMSLDPRHQALSSLILAKRGVQIVYKRRTGVTCFA